MLDELVTKGGIDGIYDQNGRIKNVQSILGKRIRDDSERKSFFSNWGDAVYDISLGPQDFISPNGYLPQKLIGRAQAQTLKFTEQAFNYQVKPRTFYAMNKKVEPAVQEYFEKVVRPRQTLLDSEALALEQLRVAHGLTHKSLIQLPFQDAQHDAMFKTLDAQMLASQIHQSGPVPGMGAAYGLIPPPGNPPPPPLPPFGGQPNVAPVIIPPLNIPPNLLPNDGGDGDGSQYIPPQPPQWDGGNNNNAPPRRPSPLNWSPDQRRDQFQPDEYDDPRYGRNEENRVNQYPIGEQTMQLQRPRDRDDSARYDIPEDYDYPGNDDQRPAIQQYDYPPYQQPQYPVLGGNPYLPNNYPEPNLSNNYQPPPIVSEQLPLRELDGRQRSRQFDPNQKNIQYNRGKSARRKLLEEEEKKLMPRSNMDPNVGDNVGNDQDDDNDDGADLPGKVMRTLKISREQTKKSLKEFQANIQQSGQQAGELVRQLYKFMSKVKLSKTDKAKIALLVNRLKQIRDLFGTSDEMRDKIQQAFEALQGFANLGGQAASLIGGLIARGAQVVGRGIGTGARIAGSGAMLLGQGIAAGAGVVANQVMNPDSILRQGTSMLAQGVQNQLQNPNSIFRTLVRSSGDAASQGLRYTNWLVNAFRLSSVYGFTLTNQAVREISRQILDGNSTVNRVGRVLLNTSRAIVRNSVVMGSHLANTAWSQAQEMLLSSSSLAFAELTLAVDEVVAEIRQDFDYLAELPSRFQDVLRQQRGHQQEVVGNSENVQTLQEEEKQAIQNVPSYSEPTQKKKRQKVQYEVNQDRKNMLMERRNATQAKSAKAKELKEWQLKELRQIERMLKQREKRHRQLLRRKNQAGMTNIQAQVAIDNQARVDVIYQDDKGEIQDLHDARVDIDKDEGEQVLQVIDEQEKETNQLMGVAEEASIEFHDQVQNALEELEQRVQQAENDLGEQIQDEQVRERILSIRLLNNQVAQVRWSNELRQYVPDYGQEVYASSGGGRQPLRLRR